MDLTKLISFLTGSILEVALLIIGIGVLFSHKKSDLKKVAEVGAIALVGLAIIAVAVTNQGPAIGTWALSLVTNK